MIRKLKHITKVCEEAYEKGGASAVIDLVRDHQLKGGWQNVTWERCEPCEALQPAWEHQCLVCGQPTAPEPEHKYDHAVQMKMDFFYKELGQSYRDRDNRLTSFIERVMEYAISIQEEYGVHVVDHPAFYDGVENYKETHPEFFK